MKLQTYLAEIGRFLKPHRTIPKTPWTATSRWSVNLKNLPILFFGLAIFGIGDALLIQSTIGNSPWSVFAQGLSLRTPLSVGEATAITSIAVLLLWIPLKERPGFGTLANIALIAVFIQVGVDHIPKIEMNILLQILYVLIGIGLVGMGSALYITCGLGPGPRDGAMTGLHYRTGVRVGRVRMAIEVTVLVIGFLMGGTVGLGTALFALLIGQSVAISLGILARLTHK